MCAPEEIDRLRAEVFDTIDYVQHARFEGQSASEPQGPTEAVAGEFDALRRFDDAPTLTPEIAVVGRVRRCGDGGQALVPAAAVCVFELCFARGVNVGARRLQ